MKIPVAARESPLSRVQVLEVLQELLLWHPHVTFETTWMKTMGDLDQQTSLRSMNKTDFFTREVDQLLLKGICRIGIHSAKDLPEPLPTGAVFTSTGRISAKREAPDVAAPTGLTIVAITRGLDSSDVLVLRQGLTIATIPSDGVIATSSTRREENVKQLRQDLNFVDLRGTIAERIKKIDQDPIVGVVVAKAALLRLGLHDLNEITLPGTTTPLQGQLAIVARADDKEMKELFQAIDCVADGRCCINNH